MRTLFVVSARLDQHARAEIAAGRWPRKDFFALADALQADVLDWTVAEATPLRRLLSRVAGRAPVQAALAWQRRGRYTHILTDGEHIGLPLALFLQVSRRPPRHVTIGHLLDTPVKRRLFRWLRPQRRLDAIMLHARRQQARAVANLGLSREQLPLVPYQVDPAFWSPEHIAPPDETAEPLICSAGLEYRDYPTLIAAVRGLPVRLHIAAGSRWSQHGSGLSAANLPPNVSVGALDYAGLRELYGRARFVVVPLREVENQAGITTILEGMAMGKAVTVTATRGQRDAVRGRLWTAGGPQGEPRGGPSAFGVSGELATAETGLYVPVGDPAALRSAITHLLAHPDEAARLGSAGRRLVEAQFSLDAFVRRVVSLVQHATPSAPAAAPRPLTPVATPGGD